MGMCCHAQVDFVCELLGYRDPSMLSRGIRPNDRRKLESALKGVNVEVTHRKSNRSVRGEDSSIRSVQGKGGRHVLFISALVALDTSRRTFLFLCQSFSFC